ncbi:MAG: hypothetical protein Ta2F_10960 [Termitinemataceae bacterium]|nr:MAG: hypothetical protein Ta2F_10960 [Termitinemataceae bacterium]
MKKIIIFASVLFFIAAVNAFSFGLGLRAGVIGPDPIFGGGILISPAAESADAHYRTPLHLAASFSMSTGAAFYLGVSADYWIISPELTGFARGALRFFFGAGGSISAAPKYFGMAIRVPLGLDFDFEIIDLFIEAVPQIGFDFVPKLAFGSDWINGSIGLRFWF